MLLFSNRIKKDRGEKSFVRCETFADKELNRNITIWTSNTQWEQHKRLWNCFTTSKYISSSGCPHLDFLWMKKKGNKTFWERLPWKFFFYVSELPVWLGVMNQIYFTCVQHGEGGHNSTVCCSLGRTFRTFAVMRSCKQEERKTLDAELATV